MHAGKVCEENNGNNAVMEWGPQPRYIINGSSIKPITHIRNHTCLLNHLVDLSSSLTLFQLEKSIFAYAVVERSEFGLLLAVCAY